MAQRINGSKTKKIQNLITIGVTFIILVILSTILAKSLSNALNITRLRVFGSISIILIAFRIMLDESSFIRFLRPSIVILLGLIFSLNLNELYFQLNINKELVFNSLISAISAMVLTSTATLVDLPEMEREIDYFASAILFLISLKILLGI
ncbi:hypothetical protein C9439_05465 [archaeon SCG-AAA382B04]|nr:hypothetical protein C9439_05465 [archaeon SCG-AAA382B04]